jgi:hypothetical protein
MPYRRRGIDAVLWRIETNYTAADNHDGSFAQW